MQGRADKGLFITTGPFTRKAIEEATQDGTYYEEEIYAIYPATIFIRRRSS
jgi:hypothetical protein